MASENPQERTSPAPSSGAPSRVRYESGTLIHCDNVWRFSPRMLSFPDDYDALLLGGDGAQQDSGGTDASPGEVRMAPGFKEKVRMVQESGAQPMLLSVVKFSALDTSCKEIVLRFALTYDCKPVALKYGSIDLVPGSINVTVDGGTAPVPSQRVEGAPRFTCSVVLSEKMWTVRDLFLLSVQMNASADSRTRVTFGQALTVAAVARKLVIEKHASNGSSAFPSERGRRLKKTDLLNFDEQQVGVSVVPDILREFAVRRKDETKGQRESLWEFISKVLQDYTKTETEPVHSLRSHAERTTPVGGARGMKQEAIAETGSLINATLVGWDDKQVYDVVRFVDLLVGKPVTRSLVLNLLEEVKPEIFVSCCRALATRDLRMPVGRKGDLATALLVCETLDHATTSKVTGRAKVEEIVNDLREKVSALSSQAARLNSPRRPPASRDTSPAPPPPDLQRQVDKFRKDAADLLTSAGPVNETKTKKRKGSASKPGGNGSKSKKPRHGGASKKVGGETDSESELVPDQDDPPNKPDSRQHHSGGRRKQLGKAFNAPQLGTAFIATRPQRKVSAPSATKVPPAGNAPALPDLPPVPRALGEANVRTATGLRSKVPPQPEGTEQNAGKDAQPADYNEDKPSAGKGVAAGGLCDDRDLLRALSHSEWLESIQAESPFESCHLQWKHTFPGDSCTLCSEAAKENMRGIEYQKKFCNNFPRWKEARRVPLSWRGALTGAGGLSDRMNSVAVLEMDRTSEVHHSVRSGGNVISAVEKCREPLQRGMVHRQIPLPELGRLARMAEDDVVRACFYQGLPTQYRDGIIVSRVALERGEASLWDAPFGDNVISHISTMTMPFMNFAKEAVKLLTNGSVDWSALYGSDDVACVSSQNITSSVEYSAFGRLVSVSVRQVAGGIWLCGDWLKFRPSCNPFTVEPGIDRASAYSKQSGGSMARRHGSGSYSTKLVTMIPMFELSWTSKGRDDDSKSLHFTSTTQSVRMATDARSVALSNSYLSAFVASLYSVGNHVRVCKPGEMIGLGTSSYCVCSGPNILLSLSPSSLAPELARIIEEDWIPPGGHERDICPTRREDSLAQARDIAEDHRESDPLTHVALFSSIGQRGFTRVAMSANRSEQHAPVQCFAVHEQATDGQEALCGVDFSLVQSPRPI